MTHPVSREHLLQGCATCARRRAAEAIRAFTRGLRMCESRPLDAKADELETGRAHLTCEACLEVDADPEAKYCRKCGGELKRIAEDVLLGNRSAAEAVAVFHHNLRRRG